MARMMCIEPFRRTFFLGTMNEASAWSDESIASGMPEVATDVVNVPASG